MHRRPSPRLLATLGMGAGLALAVRPETAAIDLAPRSAYLTRGAARWRWQHAISPTSALRWSIIFRTLRSTAAA
jgi:alkylated DNA repair dioxygenase AlkB